MEQGFGKIKAFITVASSRLHKVYSTVELRVASVCGPHKSDRTTFCISRLFLLAFLDPSNASQIFRSPKRGQYPEEEAQEQASGERGWTGSPRVK